MGFLNVKVVLISTGILSMAMGLKLTLPMVSHFLISEAPSISTFFLTWLTPPYLYILLNIIILTIVATSKFHNHHHNSPPDTPLLPTDTVIYATAYDGTAGPVQSPVPEPVKILQTDYNDYNGVVPDAYVYEAKTTPLSTDRGTNGNSSDGYVYDENAPAKTTVNSDDAVFTPSLQRKDSLDFAFPDENEKPPVSSRFSHRKAVRASAEGGKVVALGVAKSKKQDTLESTWRTITEGRAMPLTRHLKKSDTWEQQLRRKAAPLTDVNGGAGTPVMKKSETFGGGGGKEKNVSSASPGSGGRLRKEPSLSQDELNRRVEAFIKKFNAEMRLQRQESLRQYREMINRGAH